MILSVGIYIENVKQQYDSINSVVTSPSILAIIVGIIIVIAALIGILGAAKEKLILLKIVSRNVNYTLGQYAKKCNVCMDKILVY